MDTGSEEAVFSMKQVIDETLKVFANRMNEKSVHVYVETNQNDPLLVRGDKSRIARSLVTSLIMQLKLLTDRK